MIKYSLIILTLILLNISVQSQTIDSANVEFNKAQALFDKGEYKKALNLIEADIEKRGFIEENSILKSIILLYVDGDKCFGAIQKAIAAFPNSAKAYHVRAGMYYEMRDMVNAVLDETKALELCKDDSLKFNILNSRGTYYHRLNQLDNSLEDCNNALLIIPKSIYCLNNLSTIYFDKGQTEESIKILIKINEIDPKFMGSYVNLGYQNLQLGKYEEAEKYLLKGLEIEPKEPFLLNNLGFVQFKLGRTDEAIKTIKKAIDADPQNSYCFKYLALIYIDKKDNDKACENIKKALSLGFTQMWGPEMTELKNKYCL